MKTDPIDLTESTTASPNRIEQSAKICKQLMLFCVVMAFACGLGLFQTGHLKLRLASSVQAQAPPLDHVGTVGVKAHLCDPLFIGKAFQKAVLLSQPGI